MELIPSKIKANREIRNNNLRFLGGILIIVIAVIFSSAEAFSLSNKYTTGVV
jgi:choline-glycine betaine transporter